MHVLKRRWEVEKSINTPAQKLRKISVASGGSPILMDNSGENKAESEVDEEWDDGRDDESGDLWSVFLSVTIIAASRKQH